MTAYYIIVCILAVYALVVAVSALDEIKQGARNFKVKVENVNRAYFISTITILSLLFVLIVSVLRLIILWVD